MTLGKLMVTRVRDKNLCINNGMPKCIDAFDKKAEDALYVELCIFNGYHFETIVLSKDTDGIWKSPLWCIRDRFMRYELLAKRTNYALERVCIFDSSKGDLRLVDVTAGQGGKSYMNYLKVPQRLEDSCREINERKEQLLKNPGVYDQFRLNFDAHLQLVTTHSWVDGNDRMSRLIMNYLQNYCCPVKLAITYNMTENTLFA